MRFRPIAMRSFRGNLLISVYWQWFIRVLWGQHLSVFVILSLLTCIRSAHSWICRSIINNVAWNLHTAYLKSTKPLNCRVKRHHILTYTSKSTTSQVTIDDPISSKSSLQNKWLSIGCHLKNLVCLYPVDLRLLVPRQHFQHLRPHEQLRLQSPYNSPRPQLTIASHWYTLGFSLVDN